MKTARQVLWAYWLTLLANGLLVGYCARVGVEPPRPVELLFLGLLTLWTYLWYYRDAQARHFERSMYLGGGIVMFSVLVLPIYLWRSRPAGQRAGAVMRFLGVLLLTPLVLILGSLPFELLP